MDSNRTFGKLALEAFLEHAVAGHILLLLLDGHSAHFQPKLIRIFRQKGSYNFVLTSACYTRGSTVRL